MSLRFLRFVFFFLTFVFLEADGADANIETEKRGAGSAAGDGEHTDEKDHVRHDDAEKEHEIYSEHKALDDLQTKRVAIIVAYRHQKIKFFRVNIW